VAGQRPPGALIQAPTPGGSPSSAPANPAGSWWPPAGAPAVPTSTPPSPHFLPLCVNTFHLDEGAVPVGDQGTDRFHVNWREVVTEPGREVVTEHEWAPVDSSPGRRWGVATGSFRSYGNGSGGDVPSRAGHHIQRPMSRLSARTRMERTTSVSSRIPSATLIPTSIMITIGSSARTPKVAASTTPAEVMTVPVRPGSDGCPRPSRGAGLPRAPGSSGRFCSDTESDQEDERVQRHPLVGARHGGDRPR